MTPKQILSDAIERHKPVHIYVCFSGGTDSVVAADVTMQCLRELGSPVSVEILHIDTGIGLKATRRYVERYALSRGWWLHIERTPADYDEIVVKHGFPGPAAHRFMYSWLKERAVWKALKRAKEGRKRSDRVLFVSGVRADESARRSAYNEVEHKVRAQVWVSPIYWMTGTEKFNYIRDHKLTVNPVHAIIGRSGECLCGAYATPGELAEIRYIEPETADRIVELEKRVRAAGHTWGYEGRPVCAAKNKRAKFAPMCSGCGKTDPPDLADL